MELTVRTWQVFVLPAAFYLALLSAPPAQAHERGWFPSANNECGWVRGRYSIYDGSGVRRIWVIGTTHMLNLADSDDDLPEALTAWSMRRTLGEAAYGEFYVCAAESHREGQMQRVRIKHVRNLIFRERH